jgi:hypothetical protein
MAELVDLTDKIKRYYRFNKLEARGFAIAILVISFVISFRNWGTVEFNFAEGLGNLLQAVIIVAFSVLIHDAGQRIWGLAIGYKIEFKMWTFGLLASLAAVFLTNGRFWLIVPGGFLIHHLAGHRLGWFRYGINYFGQAMVALAGPLFTLMLIILLKISNAIFPGAFLEKAILFNIIYLITSVIPIPPLDGSKMFFGSRLAYAFLMPALIIAAIMLMIDIPVILSLILSMLVAVVLWIVYYVTFERKVWFGPK